MLFPSGNPFKCHEEDVLYLQPLIPPKRFDISPLLTGGCSEGLGAFSGCYLKTICIITNMDVPQVDKIYVFVIHIIAYMRAAANPVLLTLYKRQLSNKTLTTTERKGRKTKMR